MSLFRKHGLVYTTWLHFCFYVCQWKTRNGLFESARAPQSWAVKNINDSTEAPSCLPRCWKFLSGDHFLKDSYPSSALEDSQLLWLQILLLCHFLHVLRKRLLDIFWSLVVNSVSLNCSFLLNVLIFSDGVKSRICLIFLSWLIFFLRERRTESQAGPALSLGS